MGEIGEAADPIDQSETDRHQGQGKAVDDAIDEDIHLLIKKSEIRISGEASV